MSNLTIKAKLLLVSTLAVVLGYLGLNVIGIQYYKPVDTRITPTILPTTVPTVEPTASPSATVAPIKRFGSGSV